MESVFYSISTDGYNLILLSAIGVVILSNTESDKARLVNENKELVKEKDEENKKLQEKLQQEKLDSQKNLNQVKDDFDSKLKDFKENNKQPTQQTQPVKEPINTTIEINNPQPPNNNQTPTSNQTTTRQIIQATITPQIIKQILQLKANNLCSKNPLLKKS